MSAESRGGDLFIVDNSISGWTGLRYLEEWCEIAERFDIASRFSKHGVTSAPWPPEFAERTCGEPQS